MYSRRTDVFEEHISAPGFLGESSAPGRNEQLFSKFSPLDASAASNLFYPTASFFMK